MRAGNTPRHSPAAAIAGGPTRLRWCGVAGVVAMRMLLSMFVVLLLGAASAHAQVYHGNDTGGIIPWSCENEAAAPQIAARYCARWDKYYRITSVHPHYGDFIAFNCLWAPSVNPYALPAVRPRSGCFYERLPPAVRALY
jgi:hypothetical protein